MTTSVVSTFQMKRKQNKSVGDSLIPLFLMKILQNRRYQQVAEIRDVESGTQYTGHNDMIREAEFLDCTLCLPYLSFLPQR